MFVDHNRHSIRLSSYDYSGSGAYFVTICAYEGAHLFGTIKNGVMVRNWLGDIVRSCWDEIPRHFPNVELDEFVVMPNHVHGILWLRDIHVGAQHAAPLRNQQPCVKPGSLGAIVRSFKSAVTTRIREIKPEWPRIWQRNYYERIIRDDRELFAVRNYIRGNPVNWERDEYR